MDSINPIFPNYEKLVTKTTDELRHNKNLCKEELDIIKKMEEDSFQNIKNNDLDNENEMKKQIEIDIEKDENYKHTDDIEMEMEEDQNQDMHNAPDDYGIENDDNLDNHDNNQEENENNNEEKNQDNINDIQNKDVKEQNKMTRLPIGKIKNITKMNEDIKLCQKSVYELLGCLTQHFIKELASNSQRVTKLNKRKTMNLEDIACAVKSIEKYSFIDFYSIMNVEVLNDVKLKEEIIEKKIKKTLEVQEKQVKKETKPKIKLATVDKKKLEDKKSNKSGNTLTLDQMFSQK